MWTDSHISNECLLSLVRVERHVQEQNRGKTAGEGGRGYKKLNWRTGSGVSDYK